MFHDIIRENSWTSKIAKHAPKLIANACEVKTICFNLWHRVDDYLRKQLFCSDILFQLANCLYTGFLECQTTLFFFSRFLFRIL